MNPCYIKRDEPYCSRLCSNKSLVCPLKRDKIFYDSYHRVIEVAYIQAKRLRIDLTPLSY